MNGGEVTGVPVSSSGSGPFALGGLPEGRTTRLADTTSSGKALFAVEFLTRRFLRWGSRERLFTFEEAPEGNRRNCASLGFRVGPWIALHGAEQADLLACGRPVVPNRARGVNA